MNNKLSSKNLSLTKKLCIFSKNQSNAKHWGLEQKKNLFLVQGKIIIAECKIDSELGIQNQKAVTCAVFSGHYVAK